MMKHAKPIQESMTTAYVTYDQMKPPLFRYTHRIGAGYPAFQSFETVVSSHLVGIVPRSSLSSSLYVTVKSPAAHLDSSNALDLQ
jgi:hypothetical protein